MSVKAVVIPVLLSEKLYITDIEDYRSYYPIIGCRCFTLISLYEDDKVSVDCYLDDEGRLNDSPINQYWERAYKEGDLPYPLYGIGVINLTSQDDGESVGLDLDLVKKVLKDFSFSEEELSVLCG